MAKSLKCNDCGVLLLSVKEAQTHNEVTGHASFSETEEVLKVHACTSCGKKCRTPAEQQLHTRYTGHAEFVEQVRAWSTRQAAGTVGACRAEQAGSGPSRWSGCYWQCRLC